ncbi:SDR family NAD(P)-dependent oxidoreductase [Mesorhizobium sp.]|uniref:SDR family oxidoreductase n=1 Tax=Mesorhizobium sp. TaxID=1871066 RepID=UPI0025DEC717|nr:SDR family NAD(P)-dependent oxidoreductase [Mesorhizobium sp.]
MITGAAGDIGRAIARRLAADGHNLILLDRSPAVTAVADDFTRAGTRTEGLVADISNEASVVETVRGLFHRFSTIDILVNNAGVTLREQGRKPDALAISVDDWRTMIAINLTGTFLMCREIAPVMIRHNWGRIINISSLGGRIGSRFNGMHYSASKAGVIGLTRTLAVELGGDGVTVNVIAPGRIATEANLRTGTDPRTIETFIPVKRLGTPDEVANAVAFLATEQAAYLTGVTLDLNGGFFMG